MKRAILPNHFLRAVAYAYQLDRLLIITLALPVIYLAVYYNCYPQLDNLLCFESFKELSEALIKSFRFPQWLPHVLYGAPSTVDFLSEIGPTQLSLAYSCAVAERVGGSLCHNTLHIFRISLALELLIFLSGVNSLSKQILDNYLSRLFLLASVGLSQFIDAQIWFNFRLIMSVPFVLAFMIKFSRSGELNYILIAVALSLGGMAGNVIYFAPIYLLMYAVFFLFVKRPLNISFGGFRFTSACVLCAFALISLLLFVRVLVDDLSTLAVSAPSRLTDGTVSVDTFLTYGTANLDRFAELLRVVPRHHNSFLFVGFIPLFFALFSLTTRRSRERALPYLVIVVVFVCLSAPGLTPVARLTYFLVPGMRYFRHIGLLNAIPRLAICIVASIGFDRLAVLIGSRGSIHLRKRLGYSALAFGVFAGLYDASTLFSYDFVYPINFFPAEFGSPSQIAFFDCAAIICSGLTLLKPHKSLKSKEAVFIVSLMCFELVCYQTVLFTIFSSKNPPEVAPAFALQDEHYQAWRASIEPNRLKLLRVYYGPLLVLNAFNETEQCYPSGRRDLRPKQFVSLLEARPGGYLIDPFGALTVNPSDPGLRRAIACDRPKLALWSQPILVPDQQAAIEAIRNNSAFATAPVIICPGEYGGLCVNASTTGRPIASDILIRSFDANQLTLTVSTSSPGFLTYADAISPWWTVSVDHKQTKLLQSDLAFKAVLIPEGTHEIQFSSHHFMAEIGQPALCVSMVLLLMYVTFDQIRENLAFKRGLMM